MIVRNSTVPSLRGPIVAVDGVRVSDMKTIPEGAWILRGDRGLTYSATLPEGSRVVAGKWWPADYAGPPLVSLDVRAADALGIGVGDRLTVSILGVEIEAEINPPAPTNKGWIFNPRNLFKNAESSVAGMMSNAYLMLSNMLFCLDF